jgi:glycine oxidase
VDTDDEVELLRFHDYQKKLGLDVSLLSAEEVSQIEPLLAPVKMGLLAPHECFCDNLLLVPTLAWAFTLNGGKIIEHKSVDAIKIEHVKVQGVTMGQETWEATQVVVATGHKLPKGLPAEIVIPLRPIKGQALELRTAPHLLPKRAIRSVYRHPVYLVPRSEGRLIVGATNEDVGLDERVTGGAMLDLLTGAWRILPAIDEMEITGQWVGFRAATHDHSPVLGRTSVAGLTLAVGMYRHGILLAPIVGKTIAELIAQEKESEYLKMFSYKRFVTSR